MTSILNQNAKVECKREIIRVKDLLSDMEEVKT